MVVWLWVLYTAAAAAEGVGLWLGSKAVANFQMVDSDNGTAALEMPSRGVTKRILCLLFGGVVLGLAGNLLSIYNT